MDESSQRSKNESQVPFIEIDGEKFLSDRFYLNAPTGLSYFTNKPSVRESPNECNTCKCHEPPPLFDRMKLIKSLDLAAVVIGTYTLCPEFLSRELPMLFPKPDSRRGIKDDADAVRVPTLVLHGTKGFDRKRGKIVTPEKERIDKEETERLKQRYDIFRKQEKSTSVKDESGKEVIVLQDSDDDTDDEIEIVDVIKPMANINKKRKKANCYSNVAFLASKHGKKIFKMPSESTDIKWDVDGENFSRSASSGEDPVKSEMNRKEQTQSTEHEIYGDTTYFTEVQPCYLESGKFHPSVVENRGSISRAEDGGSEDVIVLDDSDEEDGIDPNIASQQKNVQGVHHPKFMLLFEKSGSIMVVISTANMTSQRSVDGSWVQRFERCSKDGSEFADIAIDKLREKCDGSDFGYILSDFLQKQSEAAKLNQMLPIQFLRKYVGQFDILDDLRRKYQFDRASVHLVSTVPGIHPGRFSSQHLNRMPNKSLRILYGPQRVADILDRLSEKRKDCSFHGKQESITAKPWLPCNALSEKDRFIVQMTSFGSKWTSRCVESLVRQYMGRDEPGACADSETDLIENVDIIWPTMDFMDDINAQHQKFSTDKENFSHFVFLSSEGFNNTDLAIVSRMKIYEISDPTPSPIDLTPHIKTYARLLENKEAGGVPGNNLAWVMLSSACFSKGAQGFTDKKTSAFEYKDEKTYSNFELGVLFVSRLQGEPTSDRVYSSYPSTCSSCETNPVSAHEEKSTKDDNIYADANVIALPIPFKLRSRSYQPDTDETHFCETPFFQTISSKSICAGLCSLTPLGKWAADCMSK